MPSIKWGVAASAAVVAALIIPAGPAVAPMSAVHSAATDPDADPADQFPTEGQLAERTLADFRVRELSGMAASRRFPGVLYGINDSGGGPDVYAIGPTGETLAVLALDGVRARDWEAMAPGWDADGTPVLWIGDIGDNSATREEITLYKIAEPEQLFDQDVAYQSFTVNYPEGAQDAEALLIKPEGGAIQIATKGHDGEPGGLYELSGELQPEHNTLRRVMDVPTSITDGGWELSPAGQPRLVLIDYKRLHRLTGNTWATATGPVQVQREALAWPWLPGGRSSDSVLLGSEGAFSAIVTAPGP